MRYPDLAKSVPFGSGVYTTENLLREFVFGSGAWSADEASVAAFDRVVAALKAKPFALDDADFDRVAGMLRQINFPPHVAIELTHLRNVFVMSPKEPPP